MLCSARDKGGCSGLRTSPFHYTHGEKTENDPVKTR